MFLHRPVKLGNCEFQLDMRLDHTTYGFVLFMVKYDDIIYPERERKKWINIRFGI